MPDAVMLAGDRKAAKRIHNENKAFLPFRDEPLFIPVVRSLLSADEIERIVVVGPVERLKESLDRFVPVTKREKEIVVVEQGRNLIENAKLGFLSTIPSVVQAGRVRPDEVNAVFDDLIGTEHSEHAVLYLSCDIPLATPLEIGEFVSLSDMEEYDYSIGLTTDKVLEYYLPDEEKPGIRMEYYHLNECKCRHNNMHYGKPLKAVGLRYVERMYELRYQTRFVNVVKAVSQILSTGTSVLSILRLFLGLQRAMSLSRRNGVRAYERIRRKNRLDLILHYIGKVLGMRVQAVFTSYGGAVLDVDNANNMSIAEKMYDVWMSHQYAIGGATF